jgi:(p)ppGpp synthase/HD superfamily hydrolase
MLLHEKVSIPDFVRGSTLLEGAFALASEAHLGPRRRTDTDLDHPVEVARLLHEEGFGEEIVAAALLHDVVEDTTIELDELRERCGPLVAGLVEAMTENEGIQPFEERKAEHRARVAAHGRQAASIYAADKLAKTRRLRGDARSVPEQKLVHYRLTLERLRADHPDLPFLGELEDELAALIERRRAPTPDA